MQTYRLIPLTQGQHAIVDKADFDWLNQWKWYALWDPKTKSFYARRTSQAIQMHRVILDCSRKDFGDHQNHNTLDNRRSNLRKCSRSQNMSNRRKSTQMTSAFKGVSWREDTKKWRAVIHANKYQQTLGNFASQIEAARAYDAAAKRLFGEFAHLNFPNM